MASRNSDVRKRISQDIARPVEEIERRIAEALNANGQYEGYMSCDDLGVIMRKVLFTLVDEQKVGGVDVPITHNVTDMQVEIADGEAHVACELHIHSPIKAFIRFEYTLINDPQNPGKKLSLKDNQLTVTEITKPFDFAAKTALKIMGVRNIALDELKNPNYVIQRTLPGQLRQLGFDGELTTVELAINDNDMHVFVKTA